MGSSAMIRHVQHLVNKISDVSASPILITGEIGTGKEIIARIIHNRSNHHVFPFISVKCSNIDEELLEAELFGCQEDNTGSDFCAGSGCLVKVNEGTVFLDEIGNLSSRMQMLILKAIKEKTIRPTGSTKDIPIQARIICGTTENLEQKMKHRIFNEELFYMLSRFSIYMPALRERREDIPILADYFVQKFSQLKTKKLSGISYDVMHALLQNTWTYNLYELENLIERILVLKNGGSIEVSDLPPKLRCLVTDDINHFYDKKNEDTHMSKNTAENIPLKYDLKETSIENHFSESIATKPDHRYSGGVHSRNMSLDKQNFHTDTMMTNGTQITSNSIFNELSNEIDNFIKKEIDLGAGIDFYRVVEEFENKLISEALRRTNHNKNRASQLLSMNRTTLVEKLKKRAFHTAAKDRANKTKKNQAFTIFDELGSENLAFNGIDFIEIIEEDNL
jgi:DNA-binding NtrC family response regulator